MSTTPTTPSTPPPTSRLGAAYAAVEGARSLSDAECRRVAYFLSGFAPEAFLRAASRLDDPDLAAYAREALAKLEEWPA